MCRRQDVQLADQRPAAEKFGLSVDVPEAHRSHVRELTGFCLRASNYQTGCVGARLLANCKILREGTQITGNPFSQCILLVFVAF